MFLLSIERYRSHRELRHRVSEIVRVPLADSLHEFRGLNRDQRRIAVVSESSDAAETETARKTQAVRQRACEWH